MSHESTIAIALPSDLALFSGLAALILVLLILALSQKAKFAKKAEQAWLDAAHELGLVLDGAGEPGSAISGLVNKHRVNITSDIGTGRGSTTETVYSVAFTAAEAPTFTLTKRGPHTTPSTDTGHTRFDQLVAVETDQPSVLGRFLTSARRTAVLRILTHWPTAVITDQGIELRTVGIEDDKEVLIDSACHLVATAETFDRSTTHIPVELTQNREVPAQPISPSVSAITALSPAASAEIYRADAEGGDVLTEVRLDEATVLMDLFDSELTTPQISARFQQIYQGREVNWSGEVVRVGPFDQNGSRPVAALIGSADGQNPNSGRVVAVTSLGPEEPAQTGDVLTFSGVLMNLDAERRLFHLV